jgi:hypothetical protein
MPRKILLVEGKDEQYVVRHLCRAHGISQEFGTEDFETQDGGVERLIEHIPVRLKGSDVENVAVVLDADEDLSARWQSLRNQLSSAGFPILPEHPEGKGTVVDFSDGFRKFRLGVWVMPDNSLSGMLETFLLHLVPKGDELLPLVDKFLESIPPRLRRYKKREVKARIHAFLAVQEHPGRPFGQSITRHYLDPARPAALPFVHWLQRVFDDKTSV